MAIDHKDFLVLIIAFLFVAMAFITHIELEQQSLQIDDLDARLQRAQTFGGNFMNDTTAGQYRYGEQFFWVRTREAAATVFMNAHHEYAHFLFYEKMTQAERNRWIAISNSSNNASYVTDYAHTSTDEDFAETFAHGVTCNYTGTGLKAKDDFITRYAWPRVQNEGLIEWGKAQILK